MQSYNNTVTEALVDFIKHTLERIEERDDKGRHIELVNYQMIVPDNVEVNWLVSNGKTAEFTIIFNFKVTDSNGVVLLESSKELSIPRLVNNIFIIDGKYKIPTQELVNDYRCRIYNDNIVIGDQIPTISYGFDSLTHQYNYEVTYSSMDEDNVMTFSRAEFKNLETENPLAFKLFKLSEFSQKKLVLKLDLEEYPEYLTDEIIMKMIELGPDKPRDAFIDKTILTADIGVLKYIINNPNNRRRIISKMRIKFFDYGDIYLRDIQNAINAYFKSAKESQVDVPSITNPLSYDALRYKLEVGSYVAYNSSFTDVIDPANTPENANVNRINELNICVSLEKGKIIYHCYDIKGNRIEMDYMDYLHKYIIRNDDFDYEAKKLIPRDRYIIKHNLKEIETDDPFKFKDLVVEPKRDERLSITTRRIPFMNTSDTIRIAMGSSMSKQAVELEGSEPALVVTGNDAEDMELQTSVVKYDGGSGIVKKIKDNRIFIEDESGNISYYDVNQPLTGMNDSIISFNPAVKEGQVVSKGDVIVTPKITSRGTYEIGSNALCFYMNYEGYTYEDAMIISQSFAKKLTQYHISETQLHIRSKDLVTKITELGSLIKSGEFLVEMDTPTKTTNKMRSIYDEGGPLGVLHLGFQRNNFRVPNNIDKGFLIGIKIVANPDVTSTNDVTIKTIEDYLRLSKVSNDWDEIDNKYKNLKIYSDIEFRSDDAYIIIFKILKISEAHIGSKLCNRYGSKGEVVMVMPDNLMPREVLSDGSFGRSCDLIFNPPAPLARKNISQEYECLVSKIVRAVYEIAHDMLVGTTNPTAIAENFGILKKILKKYYGNKFENTTLDEMIKLIKGGVTNFRMDVGSYSNISYETLAQWASNLEVTEKQEVYCPDVIIADGPKTGLKCYDPDQVDISKIPNAKLHEIGYIEAPVLTGDNYILRLYHSADYVGKVTPSGRLSGVEPKMTRGLYRGEEGQKIGEMENVTFQARGIEHIVQSKNPNRITDQYRYGIGMLLAGFAIVDENGYPLMSEYRDKLKALIGK
jgi:hypothetical protein